MLTGDYFPQWERGDTQSYCERKGHEQEGAILHRSAFVTESTTLDMRNRSLRNSGRQEFPPSRLLSTYLAIIISQ